MNVLTGILGAITLLRGVVDGELRTMRRMIMRLAFALACLAASLVLLLAGAAYLLWGFYQYGVAHMPSYCAAGTVALAAFLGALLLALMARWRSR